MVFPMHRQRGDRYQVERLLKYTDTLIMLEFIDEDSRSRIQDRICQVDFVIGGLVAR
jgi:hypothetical protein